MSVVIAYKNFAANRNISHIGLGVAAVNTAKVLRREGIQTNVWPILSAADLRARLKAQPAEQVIISAPWIPTAELQSLATDFSETYFAVNCHSNVGFLQADPGAIKLVRETLELEMATHNVRLAGNSRRFCRWMEDTFDGRCHFLPNLYFLDTPPPRQRTFCGSSTLRIGIFGAVRPLKNLMSAAGAALEISHNLRVPLELWLSAGRSEGGGETVMAAVKEMVSGLPSVKLVLKDWQSWPAFRQTVSHMHLLLQPSYTESFNMVTADGAAEGVASVVSEAIDWAPEDWKADVDDVLNIARVGRRLLCDTTAAEEGVRALEEYVANGIIAYRSYFKIR
jgi:hypothetical protein